jgi:hypothetical protein
MSQYENAPPVAPTPVPAKRSGCGCWLWGLAGVGVVGLLMCCGIGGVTYWTFTQIVDMMGDELANDPVVQEHLGEVEETELDFQRSSELGWQTLAIRVKGSKGEGTILVDPNAVDPNGRPVGGTLELDDGTTIPLSEMGPEDEVELEVYEEDMTEEEMPAEDEAPAEDAVPVEPQ